MFSSSRKKCLAVVALLCAVCACVTLASIHVSRRFDDLAARLDAATSKLARLEKRVTAREAADPWLPVECSYEFDLGTSADHPCFTSFENLRLAPQKFHGRWIAVRAYYMSGFETSALMAEVPSAGQNLIAQHLPQVWVDAPIPVTWPPKKMNIIGLFVNGPSGHMSAYFGTLRTAKVIPNNERQNREEAQACAAGGLCYR